MKQREPEKKVATQRLIRSKLSKIQFPEACPVCLKPPEDLVSITVIQKSVYDRTNDSAASVWMRKESGPDLALVSGGAAVFWIPTCIRHGSGRLRTLKTKLMPVVIFFVLFYPALYFALGIVNAFYNPRPILEPTTGFIVTVAGIAAAAFYGFYPRALERALRFIDIDRTHDYVFLRIRNERYASMFMDLNSMHSELLSSMDMRSGESSDISSQSNDKLVRERPSADEKNDK